MKRDFFTEHQPSILHILVRNIVSIFIPLSYLEDGCLGALEVELVNDGEPPAGLGGYHLIVGVGLLFDSQQQHVYITSDIAHIEGGILRLDYCI